MSLFRKSPYSKIPVKSFLDKVPLIKDLVKEDEEIPKKNVESTTFKTEALDLDYQADNSGKQVKRENITIDLDLDNGIFRKSELNEHEVVYLKAKDFVEFSGVGIKGGRLVKYLLKPRHNETPVHFFYCKIIEEYLREFTKEVVLYVTVKPDIVFKAGGQKFAIEAETGRMVKDRNKMEIKVGLLNKEYGKDWFFVVTSYKLREKYERWGRTLVLGEVAGELGRIFENAKQLRKPLNSPNPAK